MKLYFVLQGLTCFYWVLLGLTGFAWVLLSFSGLLLFGLSLRRRDQGFSFALLGFFFTKFGQNFTGFHRVQPSFPGFYRI